MRALLAGLSFVLLLVSCAPGPSPSAPVGGSQTGSAAPEGQPGTMTEEGTDSAKAGVQPDAGDVRGVVEEFGRRLRNVSLLAPPEQRAAALRENYGPLVAPALLQRWLDDPSTAPGRRVSSPWPDRIEIGRVHEQNGRSEVDGTLVEMTSAGESGRTPVRLSLERNERGWTISDYHEVQLQPEPEADGEPGPADAVRVVTDYFLAIDARDYRGAWDLWSASGPPGQTYEQFVAGYRDTAAVSVTPGTPSAIGAAAGSRYIDVPVRIIAKTTSGRVQHFEGTFTLRRAVVDGATERQRRWHIEKASIRELR